MPCLPVTFVTNVSRKTSITHKIITASRCNACWTETEQHSQQIHNQNSITAVALTWCNVTKHILNKTKLWLSKVLTKITCHSLHDIVFLHQSHSTIYLYHTLHGTFLLSILTVLAEQQEGHRNCKKTCSIIQNIPFYGLGPI